MKNEDIDQQRPLEHLDYIESIISKIPAKSDRLIALSIMLQVKTKKLKECCEELHQVFYRSENRIRVPTEISLYRKE